MRVRCENYNDGRHFHSGHRHLFPGCVGLRRRMRKAMSMWELIMGAVMATGLTVYLVYALLRPEKF